MSVEARFTGNRIAVFRIVNTFNGQIGLETGERGCGVTSGELKRGKFEMIMRVLDSRVESLASTSDGDMVSIMSIDLRAI